MGSRIKILSSIIKGNNTFKEYRYLRASDPDTSIQSLNKLHKNPKLKTKAVSNIIERTMWGKTPLAETNKISLGLLNDSVDQACKNVTRQIETPPAFLGAWIDHTLIINMYTLAMYGLHKFGASAGYTSINISSLRDRFMETYADKHLSDVINHSIVHIMINGYGMAEDAIKYFLDNINSFTAPSFKKGAISIIVHYFKEKPIAANLVPLLEKVDQISIELENLGEFRRM